ncbi:MAG: ATP-binding protein [Scytonema sp. RU_4_4]|nr:ATP-binding protein [Scytonema sp. RU_4_4]
MMTDLIARRNPYIIGRPIDEQELLFGRENIFQFIEDNLKLGVKVVFLYGQRRIGLSSVIRNIPKSVAPEEFVFVTFDIQEHSQKTFSSLLHSLSIDIIAYLNLDKYNITLPLASELEAEPEIFYCQFLLQVYERLGGKKIVFLLKEVESLEYKDTHSDIKKICCYLQSIIQQQEKLFIISLLEDN